MRKLLIPMMLILVMAFAFGGCKKKDVEPGPGGKETPNTMKEPYKIGAVFAVTGPASWLGEPEKNTVEMLVEQINSAGGVNGHKIEVIVEDSQANPDKAKALVQKLIQRDEVIAVIGPSTSGESMAIKDLMNEEEVPLISCAAAEAIVKPIEGAKWIFKVPQTDADAARRIYECMKELGLTKAGLLTAQTGFGGAGREQLKALAPDYEIEIVGDETYAKDASDLKVELQKLKDAGAEAVINWSILPVQAKIAGMMKDIDFGAQLFQSHGYGNPKYATEGGIAADGTIFPAGRLLVAELLEDDNSQKSLLVKYKKDYESKYKEDVSTFGGHAYDALLLLVDALKEVGPDKAKIRDQFETRHGEKAFIGTGGVFQLSDEDHCGLDKQAFELMTVKDGKFVPYKKE